MIYSLDNETLIEDSVDNISLSNGKSFVCVITFEQLPEMADKLYISDKILYECLNGRTSKFDSYEGFDYISLKIPKIDDLLRTSKKTCIFFTKDLLVFICEDDSLVEEMISEIKSMEIKCTNISKMLYMFFDKLTSEDTYFIDSATRCNMKSIA